MLPNYLIAEHLAAYKNAIHSIFPLQSFREFHDEANLKEVCKLERGKVLADVMQMISNLSGQSIGELVKELDSEIVKCTNEFIAKHQERKQEAEFLLEHVVSYLTKEYESSSQIHLELDPYLATANLHQLLESDKLKILMSFRHYWKPGNAQFHEKFQLKLERETQRIQRVTKDRQRLFLEGKAKEETEMIEAFKQEILQNLNQLELFTSNPAMLAAKLEEIRSFIGGHEEFSKTVYRQLHYKIFAEVMETKMFSSQSEGNEVIEFVEQLASKIKSIFHELTESNAMKETRIVSEIQKLLANMLLQYSSEMGKVIGLNQHHVNLDPRKLESYHQRISKRLMSSLPKKILKISPRESVEGHCEIMRCNLEKYWTTVKEENNEKQKILLGLQEKGKQNFLKRVKGIGGTPTKIMSSSVPSTYTVKACGDGRENQLVFRISHSHVAMGVSINGDFEVVEVNNGGDIRTPFIIGKNNKGELVFGRHAVQQCLSKETPLEHWWVGNYLGRRTVNFLSCKGGIEFKAGDSKFTHEVSVEFLLGFFLRSLKEHAEKVYGISFSNAIITVPIIWFGSTHRIQVKDAAKFAGFAKCNLMNEEAVAALACFSENVKTKQEKKRGEYFLVLSEYVDVISAVLYKTELDSSKRKKLAMTSVICWRVKKLNCTPDSKSAIQFVHTVWGLLQMEENLPTTTVLVTDNPVWLEAFQVVSKEKKCNMVMEMPERKILASLRGKHQDIRQHLSEFLSLSVYKTKNVVIRGEELILCEDGMKSGVNLKYGERHAKFYQESPLDSNEEVWMGTLRIGTSIRDLQHVYPIFAFNSEGIVSIKKVKIFPGSGDNSEGSKLGNVCNGGKTITDFTWTTPNLSNEKREHFCKLMVTMFQKKPRNSNGTNAGII